MRCWRNSTRVTRSSTSSKWSGIFDPRDWFSRRHSLRSRRGPRASHIASCWARCSIWDLVENVGPIQLALRLLIPRGSRLLELNEIQQVITGYDEPALLYRWKHPDPEVDALAAQALRLAAQKGSRPEIFSKLWDLVAERPLPENFKLMPRATIPYMDEPWYC